MERSDDTPRSTRVFGRDLKVGDVIEVWWKPQRDVIIGLRPYEGPHGDLFPEGAQIALFALLKCGMTIDNGDWFHRINP